MRPLGAGAIAVEREERRGRSRWNGEIVVLVLVVGRDRDARSCRCAAQPDLAVPVARAARQFPGKRGQVSHLLRHPGRHDLRGVSGQTVLERRTSRGVSSVLFSLFFLPPPPPPRWRSNNSRELFLKYYFYEKVRFPSEFYLLYFLDRFIVSIFARKIS